MLMEGGEVTKPVLTSEIRPDLVSKVIGPEKAFLPTFAALGKSRWQPATRIAAEDKLIWMPNPARNYECTFWSHRLS